MSGSKLKFCADCKQNLPYTAFYKNKRNKTHGLTAYCKRCVLKRNKTYHQTERGKEANRRKSKRCALKRFGATLEDYNRMFIKQRGCCAICGDHQSVLGRSLVVDHDHKTLTLRKLLCSNCNAGLGMFHDNIDNLQTAIDYLKGVYKRG